MAQGCINGLMKGDNMADPITPTTVPAAPVATTAPTAAPEAERQQQTAVAQPQAPTRSPAEQAYRRAALRVLLARGHREAAGAVSEGTARPEDRPALEAAFRDHEVPGGVRFHRIRPLLWGLDEAEAAERFGRLAREVEEAARLLGADGTRGAYGAQAALRRAGEVRFEGRLMAALGRMLEAGRLDTAPQAAVETALRAQRGTQASALLRALTQPLWGEVRAALEAPAVLVCNPRSGFAGRVTGKTQRRRERRGER